MTIFSCRAAHFIMLHIKALIQQGRQKLLLRHDYLKKMPRQAKYLPGSHLRGTIFKRQLSAQQRVTKRWYECCIQSKIFCRDNGLQWRLCIISRQRKKLKHNPNGNHMGTRSQLWGQERSSKQQDLWTSNRILGKTLLYQWLLFPGSVLINMCNKHMDQSSHYYVLTLPLFIKKKKKATVNQDTQKLHAVAVRMKMQWQPPHHKHTTHGKIFQLWLANWSDVSALDVVFFSYK